MSKFMKKPNAFVYAATILQQGDKILLYLRHNTDWGNGLYGMVGGSVEHNETIRAAALRELQEETGIHAQEENLSFYKVMDGIGENGSLHISYFFILTNWDGSFENKEPSKCKALQFFRFHDLPTHMMTPHVKRLLTSSTVQQDLGL